MTHEKITTIQEALDHAAAHGISITATDYRRIEEYQLEAQQQEKERAQNAPPRPAWERAIEAFNNHYGDFLRALMAIAEVMITTLKTTLVGFGSLVILVFLLIVEHERVKAGVLTFEHSASLASFGAWSLVLLNTTLEFVIHHTEHKHGYSADRAQRGSLRLWGRNLLYWLGFSNDGKKWQPKPLSPAAQTKTFQRWLTFGLLFLATTGSMKNVIAAESGVWHVAIIRILTSSEASVITTWVNGLVFAALAVLGTQVVTRHLAIVAREIEENMSAAKAQKPEAPGTDRAIQYLLAKVANKTGTAEAAKSALMPVALDASGALATEGSADFLAVNGNGKH